MYTLKFLNKQYKLTANQFKLMFVVAITLGICLALMVIKGLFGLSEYLFQSSIPAWLCVVATFNVSFNDVRYGLIPEIIADHIIYKWITRIVAAICVLFFLYSLL